MPGSDGGENGGSVSEGMKKNFPQRKQAGAFSNAASFFIQKQALMPRSFCCFQEQGRKFEKIPTGVIHIVSKKPIFCKH